MTTRTSASAIVLLADDVAALCTKDRVHPAPWVENLPVRHPDRILVNTKCLVARAYLIGDIAGPYDDQECEAAAKLLIDDAVGDPELSSVRRWWRRDRA